MTIPKILVARGTTIQDAYQALVEQLNNAFEPGYKLISIQGTQAFDMPTSKMIPAQPTPIFIVTAVLVYDALQAIVDQLQTPDNPFGLAELQAAILEFIPALVYELRERTAQAHTAMAIRDKQEACDHEWDVVRNNPDYWKCWTCDLVRSGQRDQLPAHGTEIEKPPH